MNATATKKEAVFEPALNALNTTAEKQPEKITVSDWEEFKTSEGLCRKAGSPVHQLGFVGMKELIDNAMDYPGASYSHDDETGLHTITDDGPGMTAGDIGYLLSFRRQMVSSKRWRRAGRGALGNGLRVAAGCAYNFGWSVEVQSLDGTYKLDFTDRGTTEPERIGEGRESGTEIRVTFSEDHELGTGWIKKLKRCCLSPGPIYTGPANARWFGMMEFRDLCHQLDDWTVARLAGEFGIDLADDRQLDDLDDKEIKEIHDRLRRRCPKKVELLPMGEHCAEGFYNCITGTAGTKGAEFPAIVEAWVEADRESGWSDVATLWMNRTVAMDGLDANYSNGSIKISGCGVQAEVTGGKAAYKIKLAISAPYFPMTSYGKAPDLSAFKKLIERAIRKPCKAAHGAADAPEPVKKEKVVKPERVTLRDAVFEVVEDAYNFASTNGEYPITVRQLFYQVEPRIQKYTDDKLKDSYFTQTLWPEYQEEYDTSEWGPVGYDARGSATEPHDGERVELSTFNVEKYLQYNPHVNKYGAALFIEKEQFKAILQSSQLPEKFDLLLVEGKGQATVAERTLLLHLHRAGIPVFVLTDLDVAGTIPSTTTIENASILYKGSDPL